MLIAGFAYTITHRNVVAVDVIRDRNALFRELPGGLIENVYNVKILNKDAAEHEFSITADGLPGLQVDYGADDVEVGPGDVQSVAVRLRVPRGELQGRRGHPFHDPHAGRARARSDGQGPLPRSHELIGLQP